MPPPMRVGKLELSIHSTRRWMRPREESHVHGHGLVRGRPRGLALVLALAQDHRGAPSVRRPSDQSRDLGLGLDPVPSPVQSRGPAPGAREGTLTGRPAGLAREANPGRGQRDTDLALGATSGGEEGQAQDPPPRPHALESQQTPVSHEFRRTQSFWAWEMQQRMTTLRNSASTGATPLEKASARRCRCAMSV